MLAAADVGAPTTAAPDTETVSAVMAWVVTTETIDRSATPVGRTIVPVANVLVGFNTSHVFAAAITTVNPVALGAEYWLVLMSTGRSMVPAT